MSFSKNRFLYYKKDTISFLTYHVFFLLFYFIVTLQNLLFFLCNINYFFNSLFNSLFFPNKLINPKNITTAEITVYKIAASLVKKNAITINACPNPPNKGDINPLKNLTFFPKKSLNVIKNINK